jgi:hypothetical protein
MAASTTGGNMSTPEQRAQWEQWRKDADNLAMRAPMVPFDGLMLDCRAAIYALLADVERLTLTVDNHTNLINDYIAMVQKLIAERDDWKAKAEREQARREHDSVDAYNARINEAVRHLREQEERGIKA